MKFKADDGFKVDDEVIHLGEMFEKAGHELYLVGGSVRDMLLGKTFHDLDFTSDALPDEISVILREWGDDYWEIGRKYGTIGAAKHMEDGRVLQAEVTTYRSDEYNHENRKPVVKFGKTLEEDLKRRDFTVNAMALKTPELIFIDPFGGITDLASAMLRTPMDPKKSFADDPLRMMRMVRFESTLGFHADEETRKTAKTMAKSLKIVSSERIRDEFVKLLLSDYPEIGLREMMDLGIMGEVLPELVALKKLGTDTVYRGRKYHNKDNWAHSLMVLHRAMYLETDADGDVPGPDLVLRLAALLHDVGKAKTRKFEADGSVSFTSHDVIGSRMVERRLRELRFDADTVADVVKLVKMHMRFHGYADSTENIVWTDSAVRRYVRESGDLYSRLNRLTRSDSTTKHRARDARFQRAMDALETRVIELKKQEDLDAIRPELNGDEIMEILGVKPGPIVGKAYKHMLSVRLDRGLIGHDAAVEELRTWAAGVLA